MFRHAALTLWPRFTAPVRDGIYGVREFSKLLVAARVLFQDESVLDPSIISVPQKQQQPKKQPSDAPTTSQSNLSLLKQTSSKQQVQETADLSTLLPKTPRLLLLASYLASHNAAKHDLALFSTHDTRKKRRRGYASAPGTPSRRGAAQKHRKITRRLIGAHAFVLERMLAVFAAVRGEWAGEHNEGAGAMDGDVAMAISTLASLRLLVRVGGAGGADVLDRGGKWRINVSWPVVRALGRSVGVEMEDWLID